MKTSVQISRALAQQRAIRTTQLRGSLNLQTTNALLNSQGPVRQPTYHHLRCTHSNCSSLQLLFLRCSLRVNVHTHMPAWGSVLTHSIMAVLHHLLPILVKTCLPSGMWRWSSLPTQVRSCLIFIDRRFHAFPMHQPASTQTAHALEWRQKDCALILTLHATLL